MGSLRLARRWIDHTSTCTRIRIQNRMIRQRCLLPARWETKDYTGAYVAYDDFADAEDPALAIETLCLGIYEAMVPLLPSE